MILIQIEYFIVMSFALVSIGVAGVAASRHFLLMILSVEIALVASTLLATAMYYTVAGSGNIMLLLFTLWTVAAVEAIALVSFYRYLARYETSLDVAKLSRLRD